MPSKALFVAPIVLLHTEKLPEGPKSDITAVFLYQRSGRYREGVFLCGRSWGECSAISIGGAVVDFLMVTP